MSTMPLLDLQTTAQLELPGIFQPVELNPDIEEVCRIITEYADHKDYFFTGSSVICTPPVLNTDTDIVIVYNGALSAELQSKGYEISPHGEYENHELAACYRKDKINIIACKTVDDYKRWYNATQLAIALNLQEKRQRVILFQYMTEGKVRE